MKSLLALSLLSAVASAEPNGFPAYYGRLEGFVASSLTQRQTLTFQPGTLQKCERNDVGGTFTSFKCEVKGASVQVNGLSSAISFNKVFVFYKTQKNGDVVHEYTFQSTYEDGATRPATKTSVNLVLWNYLSAPKAIRGSIALRELGVSGGIQAAPME